MESKFWVAIVIASFLDLADFLLVGLIPIAGDVLDIIGIALLLPLIGIYALIGVFELVPIIGDIAPSFLAAVFLSRTSILKGKGGRVE